MNTRAAAGRLAFNRTGAADTIGVSIPTFDRLVSAGLITPRYIGSKPVFTAAELIAYVESLPYEKPTKET